MKIKTVTVIGVTGTMGANIVIIKEIIKKHPKAAFIRTWVMPKSERERTIKRIKFLKSRHHNPFIIKQLKENVISKEELHKISNWANITFLDLD